MAYLLKALDQGKLKLKNRLILPPLATSKSEVDGKINEDVLAFYEEKTKGGYLSLVIIEHSYISKRGMASARQVSIAKDSVVEELKRLSHLIHKNGSKTVMQINHAGSATNRSITGFDQVGPSAVANPRVGEIPLELDKKGIQEIVNEFTAAALRVKKAGFDGVELHSAHGYLLNQFYSPLSNIRTDEYGGDIYGRIKIHLDIIHSVRLAVGESFPILLRLGASDYMAGGSTIEDAIIAAKAFEQAGVDMLDISGGFCGYKIPGRTEQGYFSECSQAIKSAVEIPVILTGGITEAKAAEQLLKDEKTDLIGVGRAILLDSNWAENAMKKVMSMN